MSFHRTETLNLGKRLLSLERPLVMAILNVTTDSFYDGGQVNSLDEALTKAKSLIDEGADILDIGGASSRPGAEEIPLEHEIERVIPLIKALRESGVETAISVDTWRAELARQACEHGADMINDISAGSFDEDMFSVVAEAQVPYIMMHMQGRPIDMQDNPSYAEIVPEVYSYLQKRSALAREAGIKDLILDPGFGFGKTDAHNYSLMAHLSHFTQLNAPVLVGISRKSMIQRVLNVEASEALNGSTALHMSALERGASILRVHDVKEAKECVLVHQMIKAHS